MWKTLLIASGCLLLPATASAYPTTAVFTPTGEAMPGGMLGIMAYASTNLAPAVSPGSTWFGAQVGLLPQFEYGRNLRFGGLEVGFDTISPNGIVKPVLNAKLGFVTEGAISPAIAVGIMQVSPALADDHSNPAATYDGFFGCVMTSFDALTLFKPRHDDAPAPQPAETHRETNAEHEPAMADGAH